MKNGSQFEVLWNDVDVLEIRISTWNGRFGGSADVYVPIGGLKEAAAKLSGFPRNPSDVRELTFGMFGREFAGGGVNMRFSCKDAAGHAFVETRIESADDRWGKAQSALILAAVEASSVDSFVSDLRRLEAEQSGLGFLATCPS